VTFSEVQPLPINFSHEHLVRYILTQSEYTYQEFFTKVKDEVMDSRPPGV